MRKRSRWNVRLPEADARLVKAGADRLDMTVSELVRRAAVKAAVDALSAGAVPGEGDRA
jgi:hypothetical protein